MILGSGMKERTDDSPYLPQGCIQGPKEGTDSSPGRSQDPDLEMNQLGWTVQRFSFAGVEFQLMIRHPWWDVRQTWWGPVEHVNVWRRKGEDRLSARTVMRTYLSIKNVSCWSNNDSSIRSKSNFSNRHYYYRVNSRSILYIKILNVLKLFLLATLCLILCIYSFFSFSVLLFYIFPLCKCASPVAETQQRSSAPFPRQPTV